MNRGRKARENMVRQDATCVFRLTVTKFQNCWQPSHVSPSEHLRIVLLGPFVNMDVLCGTESHASPMSPPRQNFRAS